MEEKYDYLKELSIQRIFKANSVLMFESRIPLSPKDRDLEEKRLEEKTGHKCVIVDSRLKLKFEISHKDDKNG
ncbi:hypothetical protein [Diplocloster hominis]|uniref:hypothetical protein n=1 Tax=Diplocloster hominis TaxID=3079010 RepID=UPI0031BA422C